MTLYKKGNRWVYELDGKKISIPKNVYNQLSYYELTTAMFNEEKTKLRLLDVEIDKDLAQKIWNLMYPRDDFDKMLEGHVNPKFYFTSYTEDPYDYYEDHSCSCSAYLLIRSDAPDRNKKLKKMQDDHVRNWLKQKEIYAEKEKKGKAKEEQDALKQMKALAKKFPGLIDKL